MHIHICLVSAQLLANYIPIKMDKPDKVHLVSSTAMQKQGLTKRFETMLSDQHIAFETHLNMPDAGMAAIQTYTHQLYQHLQQQNGQTQITVNITGGTKLMSVAFLDIFGAAGHRIIYTDTANDALESILDCKTEHLPSILTIPEYLQAYGATIKNIASAEFDWKTRALQRREATHLLASLTQNAKLKSLITVINAMALKALSNNGEELLNPQQAFTYPVNNAEWLQAIKVLEKYELLQLQPNRQDVTFTNAEHTRFLCGHWLEEYTWELAESSGLDYVECGVEISWGNAINELDVLAVHNNRLLLIECKTTNFADKKQNPNNILYKINSIGESLRGLFGQKVLLSASQPAPAMYERAKTQGIKILRPHELQTFIKQWAKIDKNP